MGIVAPTTLKCSVNPESEVIMMKFLIPVAALLVLPAYANAGEAVVPPGTTVVVQPEPVVVQPLPPSVIVENPCPAPPKADCHGTKAAVVEEIIVEEPVVVVESGKSVRDQVRNGRKEFRATRANAYLGRRAGRFDRKASQTYAEQATVQAAMRAYDAN